MATVSGLTGFREDRPSATRARPNVPQEDARIRMPGLTPQARPVETYSRPQVPQGDPLLDGLADSLAGFNGALQRFGSAYAKDSRETADTRVNAKLVGKSPDEVRQLIETDPELRGELARPVAMRFSGKQNAGRFLEALQNAYANDFDKVNGNFDELVQTTMKPFLEQYGDNKDYQGAFMADIGPGLDKARAGHASLKTQEQYAANQQGLTDIFLNLVNKSEAEGADPTKAAQAIYAEFYGNKTILGMPATEQTKALARVAAKLADEGKYDVVKALAEAAPRDGQPRLLDNNVVGGDVAKSVLRAKTVMEQRNHEDGLSIRTDLFDRMTQGLGTEEDEAKIRSLVRTKPGVFSEEWGNSLIQRNRNLVEQQRAQAERLNANAALHAAYADQETRLDAMGVEAMKSGTLFSLPQMLGITKDGAEAVFTQEDMRKRAIDAYGKESARVSQARKETWDQKFDRELPVYTKVGFAPQEWKDVMAAGANALSTVTAASPRLPEATARGYTAYLKLRANDQQMLRDLVPQDKLDLYEDLYVKEKLMGFSLDKAVADVVAQRADPTGRNDKVYSGSIDAIRKKVGKAVSDIGGDNPISMLAKVSSMAVQYARSGVDAEKALEMATERVKSTHVKVNGFWLDASDRRLPRDFDKLATEFVRSYAARYGKEEGVDEDDLTIRPAGSGSGAWVIITKGGAPVDHWRDNVFTSDDLRSAKAAADDHNAKVAAERAGERAKHAYDPWVQMGNPDSAWSLSVGPLSPGDDPESRKHLQDARRRVYRENQQKTLRDAYEEERARKATRRGYQPGQEPQWFPKSLFRWGD